MAVIGRLLVVLGVEDATFTKGLEKGAKDIERLSARFQRSGTALSLAVTAPLVAAAGASVKAAVDFESAFAGVRKTVDATEQELAALRQGILDMSKEMPASAIEIASVAEAAGQLGIQTPNILGFTRTMIALGETTNISAQEAATSLARLANIMGTSQVNFDRMGSSVVALGNNLATTEAEIVELALRLAGAGNQVGLSEAQVFAFAGALSSVGVAAEAGGTAFSRVFSTIAKEVKGGGELLDDFARISRLSVEEFATLFENDAARAIDSFIRGLGEIQREGGNVFQVLEEIGLGDIRVRDAILRLAGANDLLSNSLRLSEEAWRENLALQDEFGKRVETTASQLQIQRNRVFAAAEAIGQQLLPVLRDTARTGADWLETLGELIKGHESLAFGLAAVAASIGPALLGFSLMHKSIASLAQVIALLAANPVVALIVALGAAAAATTAYIALSNAAAEADEKRLKTSQGLASEIQKIRDRQAELNALLERGGILEQGLSAKGIDNIKTQIAELEEQAAKLGEQMRATAIDEIVQRWSDALAKNTEVFEAQRDVVGEHRAEMERLEGIIRATTQARQALINADLIETDIFRQFTELLETHRLKLEDLQATKLKDLEIDELLRQSQEATAESLARIQEEQQKVKDQLDPTSFASGWELFRQEIQVTGATIAQALGSNLQGAISTFSRGIATMITTGRDFGEVMKGIFQSIAATAIATILELALRFVLSKIFEVEAQAASGAAQLAVWSAVAFSAAFASTVGFLGPPAAAAYAAGAVKTMLAGASGAAGLGAAVGSGIGITTAIPAAAALGAGAAGVAAIGSASGLAEGGIVRPPGGLFMIGEGGEEELVAPLSKFERMLASAKETVINVYLDGQQITRRVVQGLPDEIAINLGAV